ncbi:MAG: Uma2 family endonuclease [Spirochaetota bacterium]
METRGSTALKPEQRYTLKDYRAWPEHEQWELINGIAYSMSPAPRVIHQRILGTLFSQCSDFFKGKPCEVFIAPVDVYLSASDADEADTVVQPDLMVVCDPAKVRETGIFGAPDFICEILSPATAWKDQTEKRDLYERYGVREYWVLNPETLDLIMYELVEGRYTVPRAANLKQPVRSVIFPDLVLQV